MYVRAKVRAKALTMFEAICSNIDTILPFHNTLSHCTVFHSTHAGFVAFWLSIISPLQPHSHCVPRRLLAHVAPNGVTANAYGSVMILILTIMSGFSIVRREYDV